MENASKALIMAGGILIALLVIGALLLMFNNIGDYQRTGENSKKTNQITKFNMEYESYLDDKGITGADVLSLINKIIDYNEKNGDNKEVNGVIDYNIKMSITVRGFDRFNEQYSYDNSNRNNQLFPRPYYVFGEDGERKQNTVKILLDEFNKYMIMENHYGLTPDKLKQLAGIYDSTDSEDEIKEKIEERLKDWRTDTQTINNILNDLDLLKLYRQYSEFKSSTFKPSRNENTVYATNGQIQKLFFEFYR